jgi:hypothetical protein
MAWGYSLQSNASRDLTQISPEYKIQQHIHVCNHPPKCLLSSVNPKLLILKQNLHTLILPSTSDTNQIDHHSFAQMM